MKENVVLGKFGCESEEHDHWVGDGVNECFHHLCHNSQRSFSFGFTVTVCQYTVLSQKLLFCFETTHDIDLNCVCACMYKVFLLFSKLNLCSRENLCSECFCHMWYQVV